MRTHVLFQRPAQDLRARYQEVLDEVLLQAAVHAGWDQVLGRLRRLADDHPLAKQIEVTAGHVRLLRADPEVCLHVIDEIVAREDSWLRGMLTSVVLCACDEMSIPAPAANVGAAEDRISHWFG